MQPREQITPDQSELLRTLQRESFNYFIHQTNPANGLVSDKSREEWPASLAAVGFALAAYPVGVERAWMTRAEAAERTLAVLRFFWNSPQGTAPEGTGYKGFYYHFLDMKTGRRADWQWAQNGGATITHGWKPECGFLKYRWEGYDEALLLYALGLGSPTYPRQRKVIRPAPRPASGRKSMATSSCLAVRSSSINSRTCGLTSVGSRMTSCATSALTTSRTAGERWTRSDGATGCSRPAPLLRLCRARRAVVASLPFAPEIVLPTARHFKAVYPEITGKYCFKCSFNLTFPHESPDKPGWTSRYHYGINLGPVILACENHRSGLL